MASMDVQLRSRGWLRNTSRSPKVLIGFGLLMFFVLLGVIGPHFVANPSATSADSYASPSWAHWLGTTDTGQDVLAQLVNGTTASLIVGFVAAVIATLIAVAIGLLSAFLGGIWDEILSTITNVFLVLPTLPLVIVLAGYLHGAGEVAVSVVIAVDRLAVDGKGPSRSDPLDPPPRLRPRRHNRRRVDDAHHLVRDRAERDPLIAAQFLITVLYAILIQAGLAFLGVGSVTAWSWGTMLYWAQNASAFASGAWYWFVPPGLCLAFLGTGLALMNFGVDEIANPRLSSAKVKRIPRRRAAALALGPRP